MVIMPHVPVNWRKISMALTDLQKGERKAEACDIACSRQLTLTSGLARYTRRRNLATGCERGHLVLLANRFSRCSVAPQ